MNLKKSLNATAIAAAVLTAAPASAAILNWGFEVDAAFTAWTTLAGSGTFTPGNFANDGTTYDGTLTNGGIEYDGAPTLFTWGAGSTFSGIGLGGDNGTAIGTIATNGGSVLGLTLTHFNNAIPLGNTTLETATLSSTLLLTSPISGDIPVPELTFDINFFETPNDSTCTVGGNCKDVFVAAVDGAPGVFNPVTNAFEQFVTFEDIDYTISLTLDGLGPLSSEACSVAGVDDGCVGLLTREGQDNPFNARFSVSADFPVTVPVPAHIGLLGLGLIGVGLSRRMKRK